jgi:hypothetical protein
MAKKTKRQVSFTTPSAAAVNRPTGGIFRPSSEFNPDYTYIRNDLKNLAVQIVFFVGALVVLSFFLR